MNQYKRISHNLKDIQATMVEQDRSSFFDIYMPAQLHAGNNEIRIKLLRSNVFEIGSEILVDVIDSNNQPIYYYISQIANEDQTRSIIITIDEESLNGNAKLYLYAPFNTDGSYLCIINLIINNQLENNQDIKFDSEPKVNYTERQTLLQTTTSTSRTIQKYANGGSIFQKETTIPYQSITNPRRIEQTEITNTTPINKVGNNIGSGSSEVLPSYLSLGLIRSTNFEFSSSMKTGTISIPTLNFSSSIINVINSSSIEIWPPFSGSFSNIQNFTCSFNDILPISSSNYSQSYCVFELYNLIPQRGIVDSVDISYKVLNRIGTDYQPLGNYKIKDSNLLIDPNTLQYVSVDGVIEKEIGKFTSTSDFNNYWLTSSLSSISKSNNVVDGILIQGHVVDGILIQGQNIIRPKPAYKIFVANDSIFNLNLDYFNHNNQQLDLYISGTANIRSNTIQSNIRNNPTQSLGTYIGSINSKKGTSQFEFKVESEGYIQPIFHLLTGSWSLGTIELRPLKKRGYNPSQTRIVAPLILPSGSEINFKIDYINPTGKKLSTYSSVITGVFFRGNSTISSIPLPSGLISGSDQLTSSFDNRYEFKGRGGIYSGSGVVPRNTIVSSSNLKFGSSPNDDGMLSNLKFDSSILTNTGEIYDYSGSLIMYTDVGSSDYSNWIQLVPLESRLELGTRYLTYLTSINMGNGNLDITFYSASNAQFHVDIDPTGMSFDDQRVTKKGIQYVGNYTSSLINQNRSIPDTETVKLIVSQSTNLHTSSYNNYYETRGRNIVSSSNQVDYNGLQNKPTLKNVGQYRVFTSDGTVSGSQANDRFTYISSSQFNRIRTGNNVEQEQSISSSFWSTQWTFVSQSTHQCNQTNTAIKVYIPVIKDNELGNPITASIHNSSYAVEVELHIYALTGSLSSPIDTYNWSSTTQFRILSNPRDYTTKPKLSGFVAQSSSQYSGLGGYGTTFVGKVDLNSWHSISAVDYADNGNIELTAILRTSSSFFWTAYCATTAKVIKHEIRI